MALYENAEIRQGGNVIRKNVTVDFDESFTSSQSSEWGGTLLPPNNIGLAVGRTYTLVLPGFSSAKIVITTEADPSTGSIRFEGVGAMPKVGLASF